MHFSNIDTKDIERLIPLQPKDWNVTEEALFSLITNIITRAYKLVHNDQILGMGAITYHKTTAWLSHIVVAESFRNKGFGAEITQFLVHQAWNNGCINVQLTATEQGLKVYEKVGFKQLSEYHFYSGIELKEEVDDSFVFPFNLQLKNAILALDLTFSKEDRTLMLGKHLQDGLYYIEDGELKGFYLPTLTEGLVLANDNKAGLTLLHIHLRTNQKVVVPTENHFIINLFDSLGHSAFMTAPRMYIGKKPEVQLSAIFNRIGGALG